MQVAYLVMYSRHNIKHCIYHGPGPSQGRRNSAALGGTPALAAFLQIAELVLFLAQLMQNRKATSMRVQCSQFHCLHLV